MSLCFQYELGSFIKFNSEYYYEEGLQRGINEILYVNYFDDLKTIKAIRYFKNNIDSKILVGLIEKYINDFKDKDKALYILKCEVLKCFPKATELLDQFNYDNFAKTYITRVVREDIIKAYNKVQRYSNKIFEDLIEK